MDKKDSTTFILERIDRYDFKNKFLKTHKKRLK